MPVTAKICGLRTPETLDAAIAGGASHVGLMFYPPSPRAVSFEQAAALVARVPSHVRKVGVFVDPDDAQIDAAASAGRLDALQLHKTTAARRSELKRRTGLEIWAVMPIKTRADLAYRGYIDAADRVLLDAKTPDLALPGGMGLRFDWKLLEGIDHPLPWALAGGLTADNVREAVGVTGAPLVDVSSGVETAPGVKDVDKIAAFLQAVGQL